MACFSKYPDVEPAPITLAKLELALYMGTKEIIERKKNKPHIPLSPFIFLKILIFLSIKSLLFLLI